MITPEFLDELDEFETAMKRRVNALFQGEQTSSQVGEGLTFSDYRRYVPGDDTRLIDWKLYGRTDEFHVKQYEAERNLTVHVLVDRSGSMGFGEGDQNKFEYAAKLGLGFAYLAAEENNDFRFSVFDAAPSRLDTGRSDRGEVLRVIDLCNATDLTAEADFGASFEAYADTIHTRSLVLVASDFLGDPDAIEAGLEALARHELLLAHVLAPEERQLPAQGETIFEDLETADRVRTYYGGRLRQQYQQRLDAFVADVAELASDLGARHELVDTGDDFFDSFARLWVE